VIALPDGVLRGRRRRAARIGLMLSAIVALPNAMLAASADNPTATLVFESLGLAVIAIVVYTLRCRSAGALDRARLQWVGWGVVVAASFAIAMGLMHELVEWPDSVAVPLALASIVVPFAIAMSAVDRVAMRIDRLLVRTIEAGGLIVLVMAVYVVIVLGFGETPSDESRRVLGLSMLAAAIAALAWVPARVRLTDLATRRVYGERHEAGDRVVRQRRRADEAARAGEDPQELAGAPEREEHRQQRPRRDDDRARVGERVAVVARADERTRDGDRAEHQGTDDGTRCPGGR
jgi:hypothetical protein